MANGALSGWKQIADHLGTSVRTAQRYEQDLGLPVHRLPAPASGVLAHADELDAWRAEVMESAERRAAMERAEHEAPAERDELDPVGLPQDGALTQPAKAGGPGSGRHRVRLVVPLGVLAAAAAVALWVRATPAVPAGSRTVGAPAPTDVAAPLATSPVLDPGPWPTDGHDMQRTNQGHLRGPRAPGPPRLIRQFDATGGVWPAVTVTMDGRITYGGCGYVASIDRAGREIWKREIRAVHGLEVRPGGFAAVADGTAYFTAQDCAANHDIVQSHLRVASADGSLTVVRDIGSSLHSPAISSDRVIYTIDEINFVRAFHRPNEPVWGTTLAAFGTGGIALDAEGRLYAGTDGGLTHQPSLWALAPDGEVRWSALRDELGQTVVAPDRLYVASLTGRVYAFSLDGRQLWSNTVGAIGSPKPLALARSGTLYLQTSRDLVALAPNGTVKWRVAVAAPRGQNLARPLLDRDENLYATVGDEVASLGPDGRPRWRAHLPQALSVISLDEGALLVTTMDGKLYELSDRK